MARRDSGRTAIAAELARNAAPRVAVRRAIAYVQRALAAGSSHASRKLRQRLHLSAWLNLVTDAMHKFYWPSSGARAISAKFWTGLSA